MVGRALEIWERLPPEWQRWVTADLPSWAGAVAAIATLWFVVSEFRRPKTHIAFGKQVRAIRDATGVVHVNGRIHIQPSGAGYTVTRFRIGNSWWKQIYEPPWGVDPVGTAHQGVGDVNYTLTIGDTGRDRVRLQLRIELADGSAANRTQVVRVEPAT